MEFDITTLDKNLVIQTLFAHSAPKYLGKVEYDYRKKLGDTVDGLTDEECEMILAPFEELNHEGNIRLLDYHKGKPMKMNFEKKRNGRILLDTNSYDMRNGLYRSLEAFLNIFNLDEIFITKKGYRLFSKADLDKDLIRTKEQDEMFRNILKNTIPKQYSYGKYCSIDESKVSYTPPFML